MSKISLNSLLTLLLLIYSRISCNPHLNKENKERIEDGFGSKESSHYSNGRSHNLHFDHEAVLGSRLTAKQFDNSSPLESKNRLRLLVINGMDSNKDGFVDKEELTVWIIGSFKALAIEDANDRLEEEDLNKDGFVSWDEHLKDSFDIEDNLDDENLLRDELMAEDKALWETADLNKDGKLDLNEFAAFNSPEEFDNMHHTIYTQMMAKRDKNKDGWLDFQEYVTDVNGSPPDPKSEHYVVEKDRFYNDYDNDGDGKLNEKESLLWLIPDNQEMAETEANHLISNSDDNKDGKLSVEEIVEHHDIFVGSEATDFGQQLENHRLPDEL